VRARGPALREWGANPNVAAAEPRAALRAALSQKRARFEADASSPESVGFARVAGGSGANTKPRGRGMEGPDMQPGREVH
jgi:hypothetical protein